jgi:hypothetical protein
MERPGAKSKRNSECKGQALKGQTSSEYVILLTISILFFLIIIVIAYEQFANIGSVKSRDISVNSLKQIAEAAKEVYLQGSGAQKMVVVTFPPEVEDNSITIQNNSLHLNHAGTDISMPVDFPVYGNLPNSSGTYELLLISEGSQVRIGVSDFSVNPSSLTFSFCQSNGSQTGMQNITFTNLHGYNLSINLSTDWIHTNATLSLSNSSLLLGAYASQNVLVSTNLGTNVTGIFSGSIEAKTANTTIIIPVTVETLDCVCTGGPGGTGPCKNQSHVKIKTYANASYAKEKVAFDLPPNVVITLGNWTANITVTLDVKDVANTSISGYPKNVQTNSSGGYSETWNIGTYGTGAYTIYSNDSTITKTKIIQVTQCS